VVAKDELKEHLDAIVGDVIVADQCYFLLQEIGKNVDAVNEKNFGVLFGFIQNCVISVFILSVARLYELPKRYQIRGIPATLDFLDEKKELITIDNRDMLAAELGIDVSRQMSDAELTNAAVAAIRCRLPNSEETPLFDALDAIKFRRDKTIAHNEVVDHEQMPDLTFRQALDLLDLAKRFIASIGGYFNISYTAVQRGQKVYLLSQQAQSVAVAMQRLFEDAELAEPRYPQLSRKTRRRPRTSTSAPASRSR